MSVWYYHADVILSQRRDTLGHGGHGGLEDMVDIVNIVYFYGFLDYTYFKRFDFFFKVIMGGKDLFTSTFNKIWTMSFNLNLLFYDLAVVFVWKILIWIQQTTRNPYTYLYVGVYLCRIVFLPSEMFPFSKIHNLL